VAQRRPFPWPIAIATLLIAGVPYFTDDVQLRESLLLASVYVILASNLNLIIGYAGYVNVGNIVFFGLGGYICVYLVNDWHWHLVAAALAPALRSVRSRCCSTSASCACAARSSRSQTSSVGFAIASESERDCSAVGCRIAEHARRIYLDLSDKHWGAVEIGPD
jgi:hypothetical protein